MFTGSKNPHRRMSRQEFVFWTVVGIAIVYNAALVVTAVVATTTGKPPTREDCPCQGDRR